eukprot:TRINITY_DN10882_c0_g1_i2.p1 TRINITY_DN10882_c0_g1~~TRINITY_DN10882_c0_g1_i2.p1  ORF type:complete len:813 (+),score=143.57 TRINITY_DN10882_c0_g1_i2:55-2493(+)
MSSAWEELTRLRSQCCGRSSKESECGAVDTELARAGSSIWFRPVFTEEHLEELYMTRRLAVAAAVLRRLSAAQSVFALLPLLQGEALPHMLDLVARCLAPLVLAWILDRLCLGVGEAGAGRRASAGRWWCGSHMPMKAAATVAVLGLSLLALAVDVFASPSWESKVTNAAGIVLVATCSGLPAHLLAPGLLPLALRLSVAAAGGSASERAGGLLAALLCGAAVLHACLIAEQRSRLLFLLELVSPSASCPPMAMPSCREAPEATTPERCCSSTCLAKEVADMQQELSKPFLQAEKQDAEEVDPYLLLQQQEEQAMAAYASCTGRAHKDLPSEPATSAMGSSGDEFADYSEDDCDEGDCLCEDSTVWAFGEAAPIKVSEVKPGMKILTSNPQRDPPVFYARVSRVHVEKDTIPKRWVKIGLMDGSVIKTTADHPVWTSDSIEQNLPPLKAEDIVPGADKLSVLGLRRVCVKTLERLPPEESPDTRVRVRLHREKDESSRRIALTDSLLIGREAACEGAESDTTWSFIAVGDSQAKPSPTRLAALLKSNGWGITCRGGPNATALSIVPEEEFTDPRIRRSHSDSELFVPQIAPEANTAAVSSRSSNWSDESSKLSSKAAEEDVEIIIGCIDSKLYGWTKQGEEWIKTNADYAKSNVKLSDVIALPSNKQGLKMSFGSLSHLEHNENCKVCVFNRKTGAICRHGALCYFCHADHKPYVRPPRYADDNQSFASVPVSLRNAQSSGGGKGAQQPRIPRRRPPPPGAQGAGPIGMGLGAGPGAHDAAYANSGGYFGGKGHGMYQPQHGNEMMNMYRRQ